MKAIKSPLTSLFRSVSPRSSFDGTCSADSASSTWTAPRRSLWSCLSRSPASPCCSPRSGEECSSFEDEAPPPCDEAPEAGAHSDSCDACIQEPVEREAYLLRGAPLSVSMPADFVDPLSGCLILEPVTMMATGVKLDRSSLRECCALCSTSLWRAR
ncbi:hypothetical protein WJX81_004117 [Elliptochloris bilobata]|uniref:Uncharacterized protein n=1 Tax=Elliptochloris bilobata TaxID=381761 RepID=A0AAW1RS48_9CHLO